MRSLPSLASEIRRCIFHANCTCYLSGPLICYLSRGVPSPPWCFRGYFHPLFINLQGATLCSELPALHKPRVKTQNLISFECGIWILTVKCNAHSISQYYNFQNQKITMLENTGYITEPTALHFYQGHMSYGTCVWRGRNCSHLFRLTDSAEF